MDVMNRIQPETYAALDSMVNYCRQNYKTMWYKSINKWMDLGMNFAWDAAMLSMLDAESDYLQNWERRGRSRKYNIFTAYFRQTQITRYANWACEQILNNLRRN